MLKTHLLNYNPSDVLRLDDLINYLWQMSFFSKIMESKTAVAVTAGAAILGGALLWAYKQYENQEKEQVEAPVSIVKPAPKVINIREELARLKSQINLNDPTLEDVKKVLSLLAEYVKGKTIQISSEIKEKRRKQFSKEMRYTRTAEYLQATTEGLMKLNNVLTQMQGEQVQLMASVGLTQSKMAKYAHHLGAFMQEMIFDKTITLENARTYVNLKTDYLEEHGETLFEAISELAMTLAPQQKQIIPLFLNTFISDEVFENEPNFDRDQYQVAAQQFKAELSPEIQRLELILMPLMSKLQKAMIGDEMGGFGGYGGPMQYGGDMGGYGGEGQFGGMGGMGGMDPNGFQEQALQQLENLRQQDPRAYQELMAMMMQGQMMGR